jgi:cardiolipin synthase
VTECFEADWSRHPFQPRRPSNLIWCLSRAATGLPSSSTRPNTPCSCRTNVTRTRPSHSLRIRKLLEGVGDLRIMNDVGIGIHRMKHLKLHA